MPTKTAEKIDALVKDAAGNAHVSAHSPQETLADATAAARLTGVPAVVEQLIDVDPVLGVETKPSSFGVL